MERVKPSRPCASPQKLFILDDKKVQDFHLPLTHSEVMTLHSMFMNPTYSSIQVTDVVSGRIIIQKILQSLNYYHIVGCLSVANYKQHFITDIFQIIQKYAQVYGLQHAINHFFIEHTQLDFIWIELTEDLITQFGQSNIDYFIKIMTQHQAMPVIIVQYES
jgi:hypothetical protein